MHRELAQGHPCRENPVVSRKYGSNEITQYKRSCYVHNTGLDEYVNTSTRYDQHPSHFANWPLHIGREFTRIKALRPNLHCRRAMPKWVRNEWSLCLCFTEVPTKAVERAWEMVKRRDFTARLPRIPPELPQIDERERFGSPGVVTALVDVIERQSFEIDAERVHFVGWRKAVVLLIVSHSRLRLCRSSLVPHPCTAVDIIFRLEIRSCSDWEMSTWAGQPQIRKAAVPELSISIPN
jgi:hypothetical protein